MALQIHSPSSLPHKPYRHRHLPSTPLLLSLSKPRLTIKSQKSTTDTEPTNEPAPPSKKPTSPGQGFGSSPLSPSPSTSTKSSAGSLTSKKKQKGKKRERASIIRRSPVEKPAFISKEDETKAEEQRKNESAFLLAWLGLGGVVLVEGIVLAASGFLPEEWDKFFVKFLYPSFTPTVFLFVAGSVAYGVLKYLQNEQLKDQ